MRALLIPSALVFALLAVPAAAQSSLLPAGPEETAPSSRLAPLAANAPWTARFEAAADELQSALQSRDERRWGPLLGGPWLGAADRELVEALLRDRDSPFLHALFAAGDTHRAILGWQPPAELTADEQAAIAARPEAEAIVCWSAYGDAETNWPGTAAEADNREGRPYACARIAYSIRGDAPTWRAFIERGGIEQGEKRPVADPV